jgi:hypothetical protein
MRNKFRFGLLCSVTLFFCFSLTSYAIAESEEEVWHDLGKGWKVKILSVEIFQSLNKSIFSGSGQAIADGRFIAITIYADATREAYLKKVRLDVGIDVKSEQLTFVLNEKGERFPLKGFLDAGNYHPEFVGRGFRGPTKEFTIVFDIPVDSTNFKLLITSEAPLIDLLLLK